MGRLFRVTFAFVAVGMLHLNGAFRPVTLWQAGVYVRRARYGQGVIKDLGSAIGGSVGVGLCGGMPTNPPQSLNHPMCPLGATVCGILALCLTCVLVCWFIACCFHGCAWMWGLGHVAEILWAVLTALLFRVMRCGVVIIKVTLGDM